MPADLLDPGVTEALRAWRLQHAAGIGLAKGLAIAAPLCRASEGLAAFQTAGRLAEEGAAIERILETLAVVLPEGERATLAAGWNAGRFPQAADKVVARRELGLATRRRIRSKMALPVLVLLMAAFVAPLPGFVQSGDPLAYLFSALLPLAIAFAVWRLVARFWQARAASALSGRSGAPAPPNALDRLLLSVPLVATVERQRNLADCAALLSQLAGAGITITDALEVAARAVPNGCYRESLALSAAAIRAGRSTGGIAGALRASGGTSLWPEEFLAVVAVAEHAGALEESLDLQGRHATERYAAAIEALGEWLPRLAYALVALFVIWQIFSLLGGLAPLYGM